MKAFHFYFRNSLILAIVCAALLLCGCGGGGGSGSPPQGPAPDFSVSVTPAGVSVAQGGSGDVQITITALNGFSGLVSVNITGMPSGVTTSPASPLTLTSSQEQVSIQVSYGVGITNYTLTFQASSGSLSHSAQATLQVTAASFTAPSARTDWVYFGAKVDAGADNEPPIQYMIYDPARSQIFVSVGYRNLVLVYDSGTHALKASIPVSSPLGMDMTADGSILYVGSGTNFLFAVDPNSLQVKQIINTRQILPPDGFAPVSPITLSTGALLILPSEGVDGSGFFVVWSPSTGTETTFPVPSAVYAWGAVVRSADHSKVLIAGTTTGSPVSIFDAATEQFITIPIPSYIIARVAANPAKDQFAISDLDGNVNVYDSQFNHLGYIRIEPPNQTGGQRNNGMVFSADGSKLYLFVDQTIQGYDTVAFQQFGVMAEPYSLGEFAEPLPFYTDNTGMVFAINEEGIDFIDISALGHNGLTSEPYGYGYSLGYLTPNNGPSQGGTEASTGIGMGTEFTLPGQVQAYVGRRSVDNQTYNSGNLSFLVPPGAAPGTADLLIQIADGTPLFAPAAFSYGPAILRLVTTAADTQTGGQGFLAGYGFGQDASSLAISIGGKNATALVIGADFTYLDSPFPTPIQSVSFTTPPGAAGLADFNLSSSNGSVSLPSAFLYSQTVLHPYAGNLQAGVYDHRRNAIYYTTPNQIQTLSIANGQWQSPIPVPNPTTAQLVGISLSPDGNTLAVGDQGNHSVITLDPDSPSATTKAFSVPDGGMSLVPGGLAVSNEGIVYFLIGFNYGAHGGRCQTGLFWKLDTSSGQTTDLSPPSDLCDDPQNRVLLAPDESAVFVDADGQLKVYIPSSGTLVEAAGYNWATSDMALSGDGSRLIQQSFVISSITGDGLGAPAWSDLDYPSSLVLRYGQKLDHGGAILLQPWSSSLDLLDLGQFQMRRRMALPYPVSDAFDTVVWDDDNDTAYVIVSGGILEVPTKPVPLVLTGVTPSSGPSAGGTTVTVSGSGFVSSLTATVDTTAVAVSFTDEHTLSIEMPAHAAGGVRITLNGPNSQSSFLDAAYTYTDPLPTPSAARQRHDSEHPSDHAFRLSPFHLKHLRRARGKEPITPQKTATASRLPTAWSIPSPTGSVSWPPIPRSAAAATETYAPACAVL